MISPAMELRYGHTAACTIPTKVTATQLKGAGVLDEEIAEGAASARPRQLDFQGPLFFGRRQAHRCGTGQPCIW